WRPYRRRAPGRAIGPRTTFGARVLLGFAYLDVPQIGIRYGASPARATLSVLTRERVSNSASAAAGVPRFRRCPQEAPTPAPRGSQAQREVWCGVTSRVGSSGEG